MKKTVLITGAARGIGFATAQRLMADGWRIALSDRDQAALETAVAELGGDTYPLLLDVADVSAVKAGIAQIVQDCGRLDGLVNNAGIFKLEPLLDVTEETYDRLHSVNLRGAFFALQAAGKAMLELQTGGVIVNIASAAGRAGRDTQTIYGMTKAGLVHLAWSAALAFAPTVRVYSVCPAAIETDMWATTEAQRKALGGDADNAAFMARIPLHRPGKAEEVANVVAFLMSDNATFMTGSAIDVSGGLHMG